MGDAGQSRYGIMEELNNRKINEKEKLANIERETDNTLYAAEKDIAKQQKEIETREDVYVQEHKDKVRELTLRLSMIKSDLTRQIEQMETSIKEENGTYEKNFQTWKKERIETLTKLKEDVSRYKKVQQTKIDEKRAIIAEIESGIDSLKEMSKEQAAKQ